MSPYLRLLEEAVRATTVRTSPAGFSWFGKQSPRLAPHVQRALTERTARAYLLHQLGTHLYVHLYCPGHPIRVRGEDGGLPVLGMTPFVAALSAANSGTGSLEAGWKVVEHGEGGVVAHRSGLAVRVAEAECTPAGVDGLVPGAEVRLRSPKEYLNLSPGFYMALSDAELPEGEETLVRLYWNVVGAGAVPLMREVTTRLNAERLPFRFKVINEPSRFTRCDAAVLYFRKSDFRAVAGLLERAWPEVSRYLGQEVPAFTRRLAPGLGLAEDPGAGESFGQQRCRLVADGVIRSAERGESSPEARLRAVLERFEEERIRVDAPYLNPGSDDVYSFQPASSQGALQVPPPEASRDAVGGGAAYLEVAAAIGRRLVREAVWHDGKCSWMGSIAEGGVEPGSGGQVLAALGPGLYGGSAGVGLFLAELHGATGDAEVRETALAALRHALSRAGTLPGSKRLGLYNGGVGIALAAARVGALLDAESLRDGARGLLGVLEGEQHAPDVFDLIDGRAGAIAGLLVLRRLLDEPRLLEFATRLGDELLRTAERSERGLSWRMPTAPHEVGWTGFSHGAAGPGHALLELAHASGEARYTHAAEQAFAYERSWFSAAEGNWPDLRGLLVRKQRPPRELPFATTWCHGAPGIALSRLRAFELTGSPEYREEAVTALRTTQRALEAGLRSDTEGFSLCHGMAGNAEVLRLGAALLEESSASLPGQLAELGMRRYASGAAPWPCGAPGETPGLFLGLAGIGHFYLRLQVPSIPSVLLLGAPTRTSAS